jgi:hypothetical protein
MVRPDLARWSLTQESLTELCLHAPHPRTRERLLALRDIARGCCASALCKPLGRHVTTVLKWVHDFNARGPQALIYRPSGGKPSRSRPLVTLIHEALLGAQQAAAQSKKRFFRR